MIGKVSTVIVLSVLFAVAKTAPRRTRGAPGTNWRQPCSLTKPEMSPAPENAVVPGPDWAFEQIKAPFEFLMNNYRHYEIDVKYQMPLGEHQYEPNGVPDKTDVKELTSLRGEAIEKKIPKLPMLYTDLQRFAVAFEELVDDATKINDPNKGALIATEKQILVTMCELSEVLNFVPTFKVPSPIESFTLRPDPRYSTQETYVRPRVWGVVMKYKAYLEAWACLFELNTCPDGSA